MSTLSQRASDTAKMADPDEGGGLALATARTTKPPPPHRLPAIPEVPKASTGGGREQLRHCFVPADENGCLGLHLSRTPWDPYPWVSGVVNGSGADLAGVRTGDCVLEANGEDLLGLKVIDIARRVRSRRSSRSAPAGVGLLLWNSGFEKNNLNPQSLSRFANCLQGIAGLLECPICLEVIRPPSWQCNHGHLICSGCRSRTTKCPICREVLGRGRCIVADKLFHYLVQTLGHEADQQTALDPKSQDTTHKQQQQQQQQHHPHHWSANNSGRLPLVRREYYQHRPTQHTIPTHAFKLKANNAPDGGVPATASLLAGSRVTTPHRTPTTTTTRTALYHCPSGQPCARMKNQHDILMHLQKAHQTSVVQYYLTADDTVDVTVADAGHSSALACVVVVPPAPSAARGNQLFFVARFRCPEEPNETLCWLWHLGAEPATGQFRVQLSPVAGDEPTKPWQGRPVTLEWSRQEILKSKRFVRTKLASLPQRMRVRVLLDAAGEAVDA